MVVFTKKFSTEFGFAYQMLAFNGQDNTIIGLVQNDINCGLYHSDAVCRICPKYKDSKCAALIGQYCQYGQIVSFNDLPQLYQSALSQSVYYEPQSDGN